MRRVRFVRRARVRRVLQEGAAPLAERLRVDDGMRIRPVGLRRDLLRVEPGALVLVRVLPALARVVPRVASRLQARIIPGNDLHEVEGGTIQRGLRFFFLEKIVQDT